MKKVRVQSYDMLREYTLWVIDRKFDLGLFPMYWLCCDENGELFVVNPGTGVIKPFVSLQNEKQRES